MSASEFTISFIRLVKTTSLELNVLNSCKKAPAVVDWWRALNLRSLRVCISRNDWSERAAPLACRILLIILTCYLSALFI